MRTRAGKRALPVVALAVLLTTAGVVLSPVNATYGDVVQVDVGGLTAPTGIANAPDGTMWFVERGTDSIGHLATDGSFSLTPAGAVSTGLWGVAVGPDGAVWFTERTLDTVGRLDLGTGVITSIPLPSGSAPHGIVSSGGALWVAERNTGRLARIDATTHDIQQIDLGTGTRPMGLDAGPDGAIWIAEAGGNRIARYDPGSGTVAAYALSTFGAQPRFVDVAPNGTVWFTEWGGDAIGSIDPATGAVTEIPIPDPGGTATYSPSGVTAGPGGIWFVMEATSEAVRYKPSTGSFDRFALSSGGQPMSIVTGSDGALWATEPGAGKIARIEGPDVTSPTIEIATPADGATYVRDSEVLAAYGCADEVGGSGLASCDGTVAVGSPVDTSTLGDHTFAVTAADNEGNTRTKTVTYHVVRPRDVSAPVITISRPVDGATYLVGDGVLANYSCADEPDGSGLAACDGTVPDGKPIDTSSAGTKTFVVHAADNEGNTSSASVTYTVQNPKPTDTVPPEISLDVPQDGAAFMIGDRPAAEYSCTDTGGSGLATCAGTLANGAVIDTSRPGIFTFTVTATDGAGNRTSLTSTYVVFKDWGGKLALPPAMNDVSAGSAVPVWFNLGDAPASTKGATSPTSTPIDCTTLDPTGPTVPASVSPTGSKASNGRVMYVWKTDRAWADTCRAFTLGIAAPTSLYLRFS